MNVLMQKSWTDQEDVTLLNNIRHILALSSVEEIVNHFWDIAKAFHIQGRSNQECKERYVKYYAHKFTLVDLRNRSKDIKLKDIKPNIWSPLLDQVLLRNIGKYKTWVKVARHTSKMTGIPLTPADCESRYLDVWSSKLSIDDLKKVSGQWQVTGEVVENVLPDSDSEEDNSLMTLKNTDWCYKEIEKFINNLPIFANWKRTAEKLKMKHTANECEDFFKKYIKPHIEQNPFERNHAKLLVIPTYQLQPHKRKREIEGVKEKEPALKRVCIGEGTAHAIDTEDECEDKLSSDEKENVSPQTASKNNS